MKNENTLGAIAIPKSDARLKEVPATLEEWKAKAEALWQLLDDIDTAEDMFKPAMTNYSEYVNAKHKERFKHLESDGYKLFNTKDTN